MKAFATEKTQDHQAARALNFSRAFDDFQPLNESPNYSAPTIFRKASCSCGGDCPSCQTKSSNLNVSQPNDPAEIEADQIADKVMLKGADRNLGVRSDLTTEIQAKKSNLSNRSSLSGDIGARVNSSVGNGSALDRNTKGFMESRFETGLDHIRIHVGNESAKLNRQLSAKAFTLGNDIFFGAGNYQPGTEEGRHLLAHELAHTMQEGSQIRRQWEDVFEDPGFEEPGSEQPWFEQPGFEQPGFEQPFNGEIPFFKFPGIPGVTPALSTEECVKKCEDQFNECVKRSDFPTGCIAARSFCLRQCPSGPQKKACVVKEQIPIIKQETIVFDDKVMMQFDVDIEWKNEGECDCSCGEYRQFVKGHIIKNGQPFNIGLCDGATLEKDTWHEDGDSATKLCYGHRDRTGGPNDVFDQPDRASGCHYHGKDEPSVPGKAGDEIDVDLKFKGQTFDKCLGTFGPIHEWSFTYRGKLHGIEF